MPTFTTNYNLAKPLVNNPVDQDLWGDQLNSNMDIIDTTLKAASGQVRSTSTTPDSITTSDLNSTILVDATSGAFTVNLLSAATATAGFSVTIKKVDTSANVVTIDASTTETIDGALTYTIGGIYQTVTLVSDGTNWRVRNRYVGNVYERLGADVASAATVDLRQSAVTGYKVNLTGTTTITAIQLEIGQTRLVKSTGVHVITYNATTLLLPTKANITTEVGDYWWVIGIPGGVEIFDYMRASGQSIAGTAAFNATKTITSTGVITAWTENNDDGAVFNATTGQFTAPTSAWYIVNVSVSQNDPGGSVQLDLLKNASNFVVPVLRFQDDYAAGFSQIVKLTAADILTVNCSLISGSGSTVYFSAARL